MTQFRRPRHTSTYRRARGFTLVEIAIVLVIIGLLLGGILKGQELINSARVRNLADTTSAVQAAFFGFVDRYRQVPGDWNAVGAAAGIGTTILGGGNDDGSLNHPTADITGNYGEPTALWEHLSAAGFIQGAYDGRVGGAVVAPTTSNDLAPVNAFNGVILVGRSNDYLDTATTPVPRRHVVIGRFVPAEIMRELDTKMDDGRPLTGDLRAAVQTPSGPFAAGGPTNGWGGTGPSACTGPGPNSTTIWDTTTDPQDCNGLFFF